MKFNFFIVFTWCCIFQSINAQVKDSTQKSQDTPAPQKMIIIEQDTLVVSEITLDEVIVFQPLRFKSREDFKRYIILKRKTRKVWPYAVLAADRFEKLNNRLDQLDSKRKKRRYTKRVQKYIEGEFTDQLKKLTKTEGQILVKLVHRQTGITTFDLVKDLKSGWRAFWYNTTASLFNISLKEEYDPYAVKEDYLIEDILRRSFKDDVLDQHDAAYPIDYLDLVELWQSKASDKTQAD